MTIVDEKIACIEDSPSAKRTRLTFLSHLRDFLSSISVINYAPSPRLKNEILLKTIGDVFTRIDLHCEASTLGAVQNTENAILVTDEQFLYGVAELEVIPNMGITELLARSELDWKSLLAASKSLSTMNYCNYLPLHLYQQIVDRILDSAPDKENAIEEIKAWVLSDSESNATPHHEDVVLLLCQEVINHQLGYLGMEGFLLKTAFDILKRRNPEKYGSFMIEITP